MFFCAAGVPGLRQVFAVFCHPGSFSGGFLHFVMFYETQVFAPVFPKKHRFARFLVYLAKQSRNFNKNFFVFCKKLYFLLRFWYT